jgi:hypothetical protein
MQSNNQMGKLRYSISGIGKYKREDQARIYDNINIIIYQFLLICIFRQQLQNFNIFSSEYK